jgi:glucose-6-phosphate dehydrogenase assembly protein OpcA
MNGSPSPTPESVRLAPKRVDVSAVEGELSRHWQMVNQRTHEVRMVARACMANLIAFCSTRGQADDVAREIPAIVQQHPARVLLLVVDDGAEGADDIEAHIHTHCTVNSEGCSDHVTLLADQRGSLRLPSVTRSLLVGDLPTALWWHSPSAPPLSGATFEELAAMSDQLMYDSVGWLDPAGGVAAMARWLAGTDGRHAVSDLAWRRLKPWRRLISQVLDPNIVPEALPSVRRVVVEHGPHALTQAWMLIGWLAARLGWRASHGRPLAGPQVGWEFYGPRGPLQVTARRLAVGDPEVQSLSLSWSTNEGDGSAKFAKLSDERLGVVAEASSVPPRFISAPRQSRLRLVTRQLPDFAQDPLFRTTLQVSGQMASALLR